MPDYDDAWLDIDEDNRGNYYIRWIIDGDEGATLGEEIYTAKDLAKSTPDDRDHIVAVLGVSKSPGVDRDSRGYFWRSMKDAKRAFSMANTAMKADAGAPWPEWALRAKAEGWKPPKNWKPS